VGCLEHAAETAGVDGVVVQRVDGQGVGVVVRQAGLVGQRRPGRKIGSARSRQVVRRLPNPALGSDIGGARRSVVIDDDRLDLTGVRFGYADLAWSVNDRSWSLLDPVWYADETRAGG